MSPFLKGLLNFMADAAVNFAKRRKVRSQTGKKRKTALCPFRRVLLSTSTVLLGKKRMFFNKEQGEKDFVASTKRFVYAVTATTIVLVTNFICYGNNCNCCGDNVTF